MLPKEQIESIKEKLIQHIDATFPEDKKAIAISQIQNMDNKQLEAFLIQNKMIQSQETIEQESKHHESPKSKCLFCSIIKKEIPSYKIDENKESIAILEINPISKGHSLVIPKKHIEAEDKFPQQVFALAKKISKKIKTKLKPKEVKMLFSNVLGHEIINLLPVYEDESLSSPRMSIDKQELEKLRKKLEKKTKKAAKAKPKKKPGKNKIQTKEKIQEKEVKKPEKKEIWLPRRIP